MPRHTIPHIRHFAVDCQLFPSFSTTLKVSISKIVLQKILVNMSQPPWGNTTCRANASCGINITANGRPCPKALYTHSQQTSDVDSLIGQVRIVHDNVSWSPNRQTKKKVSPLLSILSLAGRPEIQFTWHASLTDTCSSFYTRTIASYGDRLRNVHTKQDAVVQSPFCSEATQTCH